MENDKNKIIRYKRLEIDERLEEKLVSIRKTASVPGLYDVVLPDGGFEVESLMVTPNLDEAGYKILAKARNTSVYDFDENEKRELAIYLTCLEARHPEMLEVMDIVPELNRLSMASITERMQGSKEIIDYIKKANSTGAMALSGFIQNERNGLVCPPFSNGLMNARMLEVVFDENVLVSSDYPISRFGEYQGALQVVIAISPSKALIYSNLGDMAVFNELSQRELAGLINVYTLMNGECGYFCNRTLKSIFQQHLGWCKNISEIEEKRKYIFHTVSELMQHA